MAELTKEVAQSYSLTMETLDKRHCTRAFGPLSRCATYYGIFEFTLSPRLPDEIILYFNRHHAYYGIFHAK
jgi:hypothetical protein